MVPLPPTRVMILGAGSRSIGQEVATQMAVMKPGVSVHTFTRKDFDIQHDEPLLREAIKEVQPTHLVYSIGINRLAWLGDVTYVDWHEMMEVNVWGFIRTVQLLREETSWPCSVVAVSSDAARRPMRTSLTYCASKAALEMAVRVASRELAPYGWRVNAVAPGKVADTPMTEDIDAMVPLLRGWSPERALSYELQSSALGRYLNKQEVAQVICCTLFGPAGQTGQVVEINGGR